jgi:hypothetical protein
MLKGENSNEGVTLEQAEYRIVRLGRISIIESALAHRESLSYPSQ